MPDRGKVTTLTSHQSEILYSLIFKQSTSLSIVNNDNLVDLEVTKCPVKSTHKDFN